MATPLNGLPAPGDRPLKIQDSLARGGLYAITDGPRADILDVVAAALEGGARVLQYLDETTDAARRLAEASAIGQLCRAHDVPLLIHEDVSLAQAVGASGVHLASAGEDMARARAVLGPASIIGVACRGSLENARIAARAGANYISFGAFFPSPTKPLAPRAPLELLRQSAGFGVPRVAIGGITPDNGGVLLAAGAEYLASISAVFGGRDVRHAAQRLSDLFAATNRISLPLRQP
ncbi:MAG: thiamine phosphate synthase [Pseudomonadota bacterium]|nr:thiamine phosphate synthase [Pseudomonadota bacterium]